MRKRNRPNLAKFCEEVAMTGGELFCTRTWQNLGIEPCSWDCRKYQQRLYQNIDRLYQMGVTNGKN